MKNSKILAGIALLAGITLSSCGGTSLLSSLTSQDSDSSLTSSETASDKTSETTSATTTDNTSETTSETSIDTSIEDARKEAKNKISKIDLSLYREAEKAKIKEAITSANAIIDAKDATVESINSAVENLMAFISTQKTDAEYTKEEEAAAAKALADAKEEKIKELNYIDTSIFRSDEAYYINLQKNSLIKLINECKTIKEVNDVSLEDLKTSYNISKQNASYVYDEILGFHYSDFALVDEHASLWTLDNNKLKLNAIAYGLSRSYTYEDCSFTFSVSSEDNMSIGGVLRVKENFSGNGLDGYLINIVSNGTQEFVQVFYLNNCYGTDANQICDYIGGWVVPHSARNNEFRIIFSGNQALIADESDYAKNGEQSSFITVDLTKNGQYSMDEQHKNGYIGVLDWQDKAFDLTLSNLSATNSIIDSKQSAISLANDYINNQIDTSLYREAEKNRIEAKIKEVTDLYDNEVTTYNNIFEHLKSLKIIYASCKTDAEYTAEENAQNLVKVKEAKIATLPLIEENGYSTTEQLNAVKAIVAEATNKVNDCTTIEEVNSLDLSSYISEINSSDSKASDAIKQLLTDPTYAVWDLAKQHASTWTASGKFGVTTNSVGYQFTKNTYSDFDMVVKCETAADLNEGNVAGILVRASMDENSNIDGYLINFVKNATQSYIQIFYLDNGYGQGSPVAIDYLGGIVTSDFGYSSIGTQFRVSFVGSLCKLYFEDKYQANPTDNPTVIIDLGYNSRPIYSSGLMGVISWSDPYRTVSVNKLVTK